MFIHTFLIDQIIYNNHLYLFCPVGFLMIFLSGDAFCSVDKWRKGSPMREARVMVPAWQLFALRAQIVVV